MGANRLFCPDDVDLDKLPVDFFHLGYLNLLDAMYQADDQYGTVAARFLARMRERNIKMSIDLVSEDSDRYKQIVSPVLKFASYCVINDFEAEKLSDIPIRKDNVLVLRNLRRIADTILGFGVEELVESTSRKELIFWRRMEARFFSLRWIFLRPILWEAPAPVTHSAPACFMDYTEGGATKGLCVSQRAPEQ